jgi:hypothetical protein
MQKQMLVKNRLFADWWVSSTAAQSRDVLLLFSEAISGMVRYPRAMKTVGIAPVIFSFDISINST